MKDLVRTLLNQSHLTEYEIAFLAEHTDIVFEIVDEQEVK